MENKFKQLQSGQVFKNYRHLVDFLGEDVKGGKSKQLQIKEWMRHFDYHKDGNKFIIDELYDVPLDKIDGRGKTSFTIPLTQTNPRLASQWCAEMNGDLTDTITRTTKEKYYWKCDNCENTILSSPLNRLSTYERNGTRFTDDSITCEYCVLSKVAKKVYEILKSNNIFFETEYSFNDLRSESDSLLRFDFALIYDNKLVGLIEYDGEYHDIDEKMFVHDKLKDDYCELNNIPLLRIHHKESDILEFKLCDFLSNLNYKLDNETSLNTKRLNYKKELEERLKYHATQMELIQSKLDIIITDN